MASAELFRTLQDIESFLSKETNREVQLVGLGSDGELFLRLKEEGTENKYSEELRTLGTVFPIVMKITYIYQPGIENLKKMADDLNESLRNPGPQLLSIQE